MLSIMCTNSTYILHTYCVLAIMNMRRTIQDDPYYDGWSDNDVRQGLVVYKSRGSSVVETED